MSQNTVHNTAGTSITPAVCCDEPACHPMAATVKIQSTELERMLSDKGGSTIFELFDALWLKLLGMAKQLRDVLRRYNEKKQALGWQLEVNTLKTNYAAIDCSYNASVSSSVGAVAGGFAMIAGVVAGVKSELFMGVGNGAGQMITESTKLWSARESRKADTERALADLQSKGAQSYTKTLDDNMMKASEIMQQMMEFGRNMIESLAQMLRALNR